MQRGIASYIGKQCYWNNKGEPTNSTPSSELGNVREGRLRFPVVCCLPFGYVTFLALPNLIQKQLRIRFLILLISTTVWCSLLCAEPDPPYQHASFPTCPCMRFAMAAFPYIYMHKYVYLQCASLFFESLDIQRVAPRFIRYYLGAFIAPWRVEQPMTALPLGGAPWSPVLLRPFQHPTSLYPHQDPLQAKYSAAGSQSL
jgi:hypothetical protein